VPLPDVYQVLGILFLYLQPLPLGVSTGRWSQLLVVCRMESWRREGGIWQAVAPHRGTEVLQRWELPQPGPVAFPGYMQGVVILCQPEPKCIMYVRIECFGFIVGSIVDGEGIPHQAAEVGLQELDAPCQHVVEILSADKVEAKLLRVQCAYHQLVGPACWP